jgi:winged helix DNA-binding protein
VLHRAAPGRGLSLPALSWNSVLAFRVARHHLAARLPRVDRLEAVREVCGLHAQLLSSAALSLHARVDGLEPADLEDALWREKTLVKTWAMRGTLHLLPSDELGIWHGALGTYRHHLRPGWLRNFGLASAGELEALTAAIADAVAEGPLTRAELARAVGSRAATRAHGEKLLQGWGMHLKPAAYRGDLCFAPSRGPNVCFVGPERWLGVPVARREPAEALRTVALRWLAAYGPARPEEWARWWGTSAGEAGRLLASLAGEVVEVDVEGTRAFLRAADLPAARGAAPARVVSLLPAFDPYVVGAPRAVVAVLEPSRRAEVYRAQGWLSPVLLVDGRMAGTWRHAVARGRVRVEIAPFQPAPAWVRARAELEAERLAAYLGGGLDLAWSDRTGRAGREARRSSPRGRA